MEFSFAEAQIVDSLDKVPEDFRPLYEDTGDGQFKLTEDPKVKSATAAITRFQAALKSARADAKNKTVEKVDLSPLADYGTSPEEIAATVSSKLEELTTAAAGSKEAKLNLDKVKEDLGKAHAVQLSQKDMKIEAYKTQLDKLMIENVAKSAIVDLKGDIDLLMPHLAGHIQSVEEDGAFKVYVVDAEKNKRFSGVTAEPMTIKELVAEFKASDKYAKLFESEAPAGGGMRPGSAQHGTKILKPKQEMNSKDKIAAGLDKYKRR